MSNDLIQAFLSLLETLRQKWNSWTRPRGSDNGDENDDASDQTHRKQTTLRVVSEIHTEDKTENENVDERLTPQHDRVLEEHVEAAKDEYVYRLLRFSERYEEGLRPKNIYSSTSLERHVERGSDNGDENDDASDQTHRKQTTLRVVSEIHTEDKTENENVDERLTPQHERVLEEHVEAAKDEYVYRLLRFSERYEEGLRPKNIYSSTSLERHVERGSRGVESRYISCCKTLYGLRCLGNITNEFSRVREVVRINITKLDRTSVKVIDLTDYNIRRMHISSSSAAWGYAERFEEVILDPTTHVPKECVERIGIVHYGRFIKDDHVELY